MEIHKITELLLTIEAKKEMEWISFNKGDNWSEGSFLEITYQNQLLKIPLYDVTNYETFLLKAKEEALYKISRLQKHLKKVNSDLEASIQYLSKE